jgi:enediyne biosynthesis protein E4
LTRPAAVVAALLALAASDVRPLNEALKEAGERLDKAAAVAAAGQTPEVARRIRDVAEAFAGLAARADLSSPVRDELKAAAADLRASADDSSCVFSADAARRVLERARAAALGGGPPPLAFQGSYTQPKVEEPVYGGHASAMGPPPETVRVTGAASAATFAEVPGPFEKTYCGGRSKDSILESGGSGVALVDYDGDGLLDIYVVNAFSLDDRRERVPHKNALYRNLGGLKFENVSAKAGVDAAAWGNGVCAGDFDDDGRIDLYVTNYGANFLYRNNGDGTFTDVAAAAGVQGGGWSTGCAFLDANGDGRLDLYVARYANVSWNDVVGAKRTMTWRGGPKVMVGPVGLPGAPDLYFENQGGGRFAEVSAARGLKDEIGAYGFGVLATDYDGDGAVDLYVANDSNPNFLYRNLGNGTFESTGLLAGAAVNAEGRAQAGMGVDAGDYDNDGFMDLVVTNFAHDTNTLRHNLGNGLFEDVTEAAGLAGPTFARMGWGTAFLDADLDGQLDLFFANGHIYPQVEDFPALEETFAQANQLFVNEGGRFRDVSDTAGPGLAVKKSSRGLAVGDLDNDGDPDLVISNVDDTPTVLENRQRTGRHWVGFQLEKPGPNRLAIGARVTVRAEGRAQIREVRSGGSYVSQSDLRPLFGLGAYAGPVDVEVRLGPDRWRFAGLRTDRYTRLVLGPEARAIAAKP